MWVWVWVRVLVWVRVWVGVGAWVGVGVQVEERHSLQRVEGRSVQGGWRQRSVHEALRVPDVPG